MIWLRRGFKKIYPLIPLFSAKFTPRVNPIYAPKRVSALRNPSNRTYHLLLLSLILLILLIFSFPLKEWFSGWDNLHPEFNFALNFKRGLMAVWQGYQGLGTYGGHGYAATLPHTFVTFLLSIVLPDNIIRAAFTFLMLFVGVYGVFFLVGEVAPFEEEDLKNKAGFFAALFYLVNLSTLQNFYIQLEAFIVHFAALPWLFLSLIYYLKNPNRRTLFIFALISLLSSTQGFIPPLFMVYLMLLGIFLLVYVITGAGGAKRGAPSSAQFWRLMTRFSALVGTLPRPTSSSPLGKSGRDGESQIAIKRSSTLEIDKRALDGAVERQDPPTFITRLKRSLIVLFITFAINAYWLLPVLNYSFTNSSDYLHAYNNQSSTEDFIAKNKVYGTIGNAALIKGFIIETINTTAEKANVPVFLTWLEYMQHPLFNIVGYGFFVIAILSIGYTLIRRLIPLFFANFTPRVNPSYASKRVSALFTFALSFILLFSLLVTDTPPFSYVTVLLHKIPIFKQAFRIAFTKFSIGYSFLFAINFGIGCVLLLKIASAIFQKSLVRIVQGITLIIIVSGIFYFGFPAFTGNFIYPEAKIKIPQAYMDLFDYFKKQDRQGRIANMPQGWNWGWNVYKWGYSGSGFLWYGIEQPIMDRSFDVWGRQNENYYWELNYAIYSQRFDLFDLLMDKYKIDWILFDPNVVPYPQAKAFLYSEALDEYIKKSVKYSLAARFNDELSSVNTIRVYKVNHNDKFLNSDANDISYNIGPYVNFNNLDSAYEKYGRYYTDTNRKFDVYYPFRTLFSGRTGLQNIKISENNGLTISSDIPKGLDSYRLILPSEYNDTTKLSLSLGKKQDKFEVKIASESAELIYDNTTDPFFYDRNPQACDNLKGKFNQNIIDGKTLRFISSKSHNCYDIVLSDLTHSSGYLVKVVSKNVKGRPLKFAVINNMAKKADIEVELNHNKTATAEYFIIPPMNEFGLGYNLHLDNISLIDETINDLYEIKLYRLPYAMLKEIRLEKMDGLSRAVSIVTNNQAFNEGWKAYESKFKAQSSKFKSFFFKIFPFIFGQELKEHVLVNGWENGWSFDSAQDKKLNLVIVFWPQYLEFVGLGLLGMMVIVFLIKKS
ncbi:hypothetical protein A3C23_04880 [Candidatus Roizmanbacteria bacterium RIFCSPHIGHO2_02_FULL_37_13b]|nr:MAG: hypothetical protein A3C23_04880 [Candidatus Roizmanbacteria bacterium RIFCSPHIGHO2_02_FULL_37_13b]